MSGITAEVFPSPDTVNIGPPPLFNIDLAACPPAMIPSLSPSCAPPGAVEGFRPRPWRPACVCAGDTPPRVFPAVSPPSGATPACRPFMMLLPTTGSMFKTPGGEEDSPCFECECLMCGCSIQRPPTLPTAFLERFAGSRPGSPFDEASSRRDAIGMIGAAAEGSEKCILTVPFVGEMGVPFVGETRPGCPGRGRERER
jgi:hypothetical protein